MRRTLTQLLLVKTDGYSHGRYGVPAQLPADADYLEAYERGKAATIEVGKPVDLRAIWTPA